MAESSSRTPRTYCSARANTADSALPAGSGAGSGGGTEMVVGADGVPIERRKVQRIWHCEFELWLGFSQEVPDKSIQFFLKKSYLTRGQWPY